MTLTSTSRPEQAPWLTVFYDGACPVCSAEMARVRRRDAAGDVQLVDCAAGGFNEAPWRSEGVSQAQMMEAMHVRDAQGQWHRGADALALIYGCIQVPWLARLWGHPLSRPVMRRVYPWLARNRQRFSALLRIATRFIPNR